MDLSSESIILILTSEPDVFESLEYNANSFGRLRQHWLQRDTYSEVACLSEFLHVGTDLHELLHNGTEIREFTGGLPDAEFDPLT